MSRSLRVGMIVPSSNTTMETEVPQLMAQRRADDDVRFTFHSSRSRLHSVTAEELSRMVDDGERCATEVADADVDVIAYACLVALMAKGDGYHRVAEKRISRTAAENGLEVPVVTSAGALLDGVRALGARRISVLAPYMRPLTRLVVDYIEADGIEVVDSHSLEVPNNLEVGRIDPSSLLPHIDSLDLTGADALVLSACVQCPSLPAIEEAQQMTGLPVLSAATATTFGVLESLGLSTSVARGGALLDGTRSSLQVHS